MEESQQGCGMVTVEQDVEVRGASCILCLCHAVVYNYYITLSNKSVVLALCFVKHTKGKQNYVNKEIIFTVAYFVMFLSE
jgi:hypothetical protein